MGSVAQRLLDGVADFPFEFFVLDNRARRPTVGQPLRLSQQRRWPRPGSSRTASG